jgi:hypothetical protein
MNYVDLDISKRKVFISENHASFKGNPIMLEGYLVVLIKNLEYNSYMLDKIKIITTNDNYTSHKQKVDEPYNFLTDYTQTLQQTVEIINQVMTILKYIAIIIAHNIHNDPRMQNAFELVKVRLNLFDDNSVILDKCMIKKNWQDVQENNLLWNWLSNILVAPILTGNLSKELGIASLSLYKLRLSYGNYRKMQNVKIPKQLTANDYSRDDFNNKFILVAAEYISLEGKLKGFNYKYIIKKLEKYGLKLADLYSTVGVKSALVWFDYVEIAHLEIIKQHYNTMAFLGNYISNLDAIYDKDELFFNLKRLYPKEYRSFMADSFRLSADTKWQPGEMYIVRPVTEIDIKTKQRKAHASSGMDIVYVVDDKTMNKAKELLPRYDKVLVSQYIRNPLLFKGHKFHLRLIYLITIIGNKMKTYLSDICYIFTAGKPFVLDNFDDKKIHDTHLKTTEDDYLFSTDFTTENMGIPISQETKQDVWNKIREIMKKVSSVISEGSNRPKVYYNFKNSIHIMGVDMMINSNLNPILIECNAKPGLATRNEKGINNLNKFVDLLDDVVFSPVFGNRNLNTTENNPTLLYSD